LNEIYNEGLDLKADVMAVLAMNHIHALN